jgi:PAS domain S-box-containing protein
VQTSPERNGPQAEALDRLSRLQALTASLSEAVTSEQVADAIISQGMTVLGANAGCVTLLSGDRQELALLRITGAVPDVAAKWGRFPVTAPVPLAEAIRERAVVVLETFAERLVRYPALEGVVSPDQNGAMVALPMIVRGDVLGGLGWGWAADRPFADEDRAFLLTLAGLCGQALDRARLYDTERAARERAERAGEALRKSEERFARFMQHLPGLAWVKDVGGRYAYANDAAVNAFGKPREELYGRKDEDVFPPATAARFRENDRKALAGGAGVRVVETLEHPDGVLHHSLVSKFPIPGPDGAAALVGGMAIDITEEVRTRAVLEESEERLRTLSNNLPHGAIYQVAAGPNGGRRFLYISAGVERLLGVTPAEVVADAAALYDLIHEEDRPRVAAAEETALRDLALYDGEFRSRTRTGGLRWFHCRSAPRRLPSGEVVWEGVILDVTARKNAEADFARLAADSEKRRRLYEAALSNTPDLVYVFDLGHRFLYANEGLLRMWGKTWEEAIGKNCLELGYEPWHAAMHDREIEQVVATRQPVKGEVPFTGTFGRRIYEYIFVPVVGENGEVEAVAGTTRDVTDRKALEGRLRDQAEQLREADHRKDEFLATLAHELRNPLAPIRTGLQVMRLAGSEAEAAEQARAMVERQVAVMVRLIDDLLDVSRITRGRLELRRERVELAGVIRSAFEGSRPLIEASGHDLTVDLPPQPVYLDADPTRLAQVFGNLLTNAAKYTDRGGHIRLAAERRAGEVAVSVRDPGIGIAAEHLPRLFEMFSQAAPARDRSQGGLGIGLSLVKGLVELHGGSVTAHSEGPGKGSEFVVRLPVADGRPAPELPQPGGGEKAAARAGRRVLVADDNRDAADSLATMLRLAGHDVHAVHDGQEAVEAAAWFRPDLALLDIGMPRLNGFEAARHIREQPWGRQMVLAAITGWGQEEDKRRATEAGFDHHLTKPADPAAVEKLLAGLKARMP